MDFYPLTENAARQAIDSSTVFYELRRALAEARAYRGGMYWKSQGAYEYLVKTAPDNRQSPSCPLPVGNLSIARSCRARIGQDLTPQAASSQ
jgi:hypothetical protein